MSQATASTKRVSEAAAAAGQSTVGQQMRSSPAIKSAIDTIVSEVHARSALLTGVRPPNPGLKVGYDELMQRASEVRGRGLLYPYLGSGIGNGALVELADGSVKWDMICGIGVHFFGHSDPDLMAASLRGSLDDTLKAGNLQANFDAYSFCETLLAEAKKHSTLRHCYAATSGAITWHRAFRAGQAGRI